MHRPRGQSSIPLLLCVLCASAVCSADDPVLAELKKIEPLPRRLNIKAPIGAQWRGAPERYAEIVRIAGTLPWNTQIGWWWKHPDGTGVQAEASCRWFIDETLRLHALYPQARTILWIGSASSKAADNRRALDGLEAELEWVGWWWQPQGVVLDWESAGRGWKLAHDPMSISTYQEIDALLLQTWPWLKFDRDMIVFGKAGARYLAGRGWLTNPGVPDCTPGKPSCSLYLRDPAAVAATYEHSLANAKAINYQTTVPAFSLAGSNQQYWTGWTGGGHIAACKQRYDGNAPPSVDQAWWLGWWWMYETDAEAILYSLWPADDDWCLRFINFARAAHYQDPLPAAGTPVAPMEAAP